MADDEIRKPPAVLRLRARWLTPSPPLAVDDEPHWTPSPDPLGEERDSDVEAEPPAVAP
jgi:hypothetical protein